MTQELLDDVIARDELQSRYFLSYRDNIIAKTSGNKLARQMRSNIEHATKSVATKFALYSAHDSNLMALLTILAPLQWDGSRPPYASMLAVELYSARQPQERRQSSPSPDGSDIDDAQFYFRLLYNGKPLLVPDCGSFLCDARVLLKKLQFATNDDVCNTKQSSKSSGDMWGLELSLSLSFALLMGCLIGATSMYFALKRTTTGSYGPYQPVTGSEAEVDSGDSETEGLEMDTVRLRVSAAI